MNRTRPNDLMMRKKPWTAWKVSRLMQALACSFVVLMKTACLVAMMERYGQTNSGLFV